MCTYLSFVWLQAMAHGLVDFSVKWSAVVWYPSGPITFCPSLLCFDGNPYPALQSHPRNSLREKWRLVQKLNLQVHQISLLFLTSPTCWLHKKYHLGPFCCPTCSRNTQVSLLLTFISNSNLESNFIFSCFRSNKHILFQLPLIGGAPSRRVTWNMANLWVRFSQTPLLDLI